MKNVTIDATKFNKKEDLHLYLAEQLGLSERYGKTIDSLFDNLKGFEEEVSFKIKSRSEMLGKFGTYGEYLIRIFNNVAAQNDKVRVEVEND